MAGTELVAAWANKFSAASTTTMLMRTNQRLKIWRRFFMWCVMLPDIASAIRFVADLVSRPRPYFRPAPVSSLNFGPTTRPKAPGDWRNPRRFALSGAAANRASVLDCGGPPPLWLWPTSDHWIAAGTQPPPPPRFNKESQKAGTEIFLISCLPCLNCFLACLASWRFNFCILSITQKSLEMKLPRAARLDKLTA